MTLFDKLPASEPAEHVPLAARMRPRTLDEVVGQENLVGEGRVLRQATEADRLPSMLLWGPPGSGKTTIALVLAERTSSHFDRLSAVSATVNDLRRAVEQARQRRRLSGQGTVLFVDEIHRFNKAQQDAVLPHVEDGTVTFIGATTENPSFEVVAPLLSRCRVLQLRPLGAEEVRRLVERAIADPDRGLGALNLRLEEEALGALASAAGGDARVALNALELAATAAKPGEHGVRPVDSTQVAEALQAPALRYDKQGDEHYDTISAFIKSVRGSDPDAAVYWLARMVEAGEDPMFIARRVVILAAEDVGLADPQALPLAVAAQQAVHAIGLPEGAIPLAEAAVYLAGAPKSNSAYAALQAARKDVRRRPNEPVPLHLRNAATGLMRDLGYGAGYRYAHDYPGHVVRQEHLPPALQGRRYYRPGDQGAEEEVARRLGRYNDEGGGEPGATEG